MGIAKSALKLLFQEAKKYDFTEKSILQLGRQHTFLTLKEIQTLAKQAGFSLHSAPISLSFKKELQEAGYVDDITLFSLLGFSEVHSLDVSYYEQATFIHDLNTPITIENRYDVIFDGGTLEHIFHVPQVLKNIHTLLKPNGLIIHASPSHNHVDHGFYMFSPTLFYDYYSTNQYDILSSYLFEYTSPGNSSWKVFQYVPGCLDFLSFGGFGKKMVGIWFVARRILQSTDGIIPRQRACLKSWETQEMSRSSISNNMKRALKKIPKLRSLIVFFRGKIARLIHHRRLKKVKV